MLELRTERRVEFADTDASGVVHFARFFVFMEAAEHELMRSISPGLPLEFEGRSVLWPRAAAACSYKKPVLYRDLLEIEARVDRRGKTSLRYDFVLRRSGEEVATGHIVTVYCVRASGAFRPMPLPEAIAARLAGGASA